MLELGLEPRSPNAQFRVLFILPKTLTRLLLLLFLPVKAKVEHSGSVLSLELYEWHQIKQK